MSQMTNAYGGEIGILLEQDIAALHKQAYMWTKKSRYVGRLRRQL